MGKKILVPCLDVIMIAFFLFSIRKMVFHCIFLGKKVIIITSKQGTRILFGDNPFISVCVIFTRQTLVPTYKLLCAHYSIILK